MAQLFIVPEEEYKIISKYLVDMDGSVLVPESFLNDPCFHADAAEKVRHRNGKEIDYDFGGEPDISVDIVTSKDHFALDSIIYDQDDEEEDI